MEWTLLLTLGAIWLVSPVVLLIVLLATRRRLERTRQRLVLAQAATPVLDAAVSPVTLDGGQRLAGADLDRLLVLRQALLDRRDGDTSTADSWRSLLDALDRRLNRHLTAGGLIPETPAWNQARAAGWALLSQSLDTPPGRPPWLSPRPTQTDRPAPPPLAPVVAPPVATEAVPESLTLDATAFEPAPLPPRTAPLAATRPREPETRRTEAPSWSRAPRPDPDWRPAAPSALELAVRRVSGWPRLIVPFLLQNIGWFIGGFCFISGALFLIANTSGFLNALTVLGSLMGATVFLLWAGYRFQRQGDALLVASRMLLTLGMLLAPLDLAVAIRLLDASGESLALAGVSLVLIALTLAGLAWAAALSSALMDKALRGAYPWWLTALAAVQLAAPLARVAPDWPALAGLHALLLALLALALRRFRHDWLRRLFIDRGPTTYYAAGLLVYTATISFVHLTWIWPTSLPAGYAGPFLMALCALLFQVDVALKEWTSRYAFLSRLTLALHGLAVSAITLSLASEPALIATLTLGALLHAWVTWSYRTAPALYLLLGCLAGLHGTLVLTRIPPDWHLLASLPGLLALLAVARWAMTRSRVIALQSLLASVLLLLGLAAWSLWWGTPGWLGMTNAGLAALLLLATTRLALSLPEADPRWRLADIGLPVLAAIAVAEAPAWAPLDWAFRTALGWLGLAALWTWLGLRTPAPATLARRIRIQGALIHIGLALALGAMAVWPSPIGQPEPIGLLALAAALLLWLGLGLGRQDLLYLVLALVAATAFLVKRGYFPGPSSGLGEFMGVLALWTLLAWVGWRARRHAAVNALLTGTRETSSSQALEALIRVPLERAMALLWAVGLFHLGVRWLEGSGPSHWTLAIALGLATGLLTLGQLRLHGWIALPFLLGLAGLLVALDDLGASLPWLGAAALIHGLLVWRVGCWCMARPLVWRLARITGLATPNGQGGRARAESSLRALAVLTATIAVAASAALSLLDHPAPALMPMLGLALLVFVLASREQGSSALAAAALATLTLAVWLLGAWLAPVDLLGLEQPLTNALLSLALSLAALESTRRAGMPDSSNAPSPSRSNHWLAPLRWTGGLLYLLALAGALLGVLVAAPGLPILAVALAIALFPVTTPLPRGADWRGSLLAPIVGLLIASLLGGTDWSASELALAAISWGYLLWLAHPLLSTLDRRWPRWAVASAHWPWLGLAAVLAGAVLGSLSGWLTPAGALTLTAVYWLLLMRDTAWPGLGWLALGALTASVALAADLLAWRPSNLVALLLWSNLLLLTARLWRRYGDWIARRLAWRASPLEAPLVWIPFGLLTAAALGLALEVIGWHPGAPLTTSRWTVAGLALALALSAVHAFHTRPTRAQGHLVILTLTTLFGALWVALAVAPDWLPPGLALWSGALLALNHLQGDADPIRRETLTPWLILLPVLAVLLALAPPAIDWTLLTLTLAIIAALASTHGWLTGTTAWLRTGAVLALATLHGVWLMGAESTMPAALGGLAPWYGLQAILLWLAWPTIEQWLDRPPTGSGEPSDSERKQHGRAHALLAALVDTRPWVLALGLAWLGWHGWTLLADRAGWSSLSWSAIGPGETLAGGCALLLLAGHAAIGAWRRPEDAGAVQRTALLFGLLALQARLAVWGLAPLGPIDTLALMFSAYLALLAHRLGGSPHWARLASWLPLLALATTPAQLASTWTGATLVASGLLYLSLAARSHRPWPLYLGVLALNGAIYLWAPLWAERYGLWQFHIAPAAISVLILLHLHRRELRPGVLSGARLAALSLLYAGAALDLFLRPDLALFALALALALTGVLLGLALRIRAFLYGGVAFLVLNVVGQLVRFYPEPGIGRALILLGLGAAITGGMVIFNLKRESILRRVRILRADLADWE